MKIDHLQSALKELLGRYNYNYYEVVLPQITELVENGIITFEYGEPVIIRNEKNDGFEVKQEIKLICKAKEEIEALKKEIIRLNDIIDGARYS